MWRWNHWDKVCIYIYLCMVVRCCLLTFFSSFFLSLLSLSSSEACDDGDAITSNGCTYPTCTQTAGWYVVFSLIPSDIIPIIYPASSVNIFSYSYSYSYSITGLVLELDSLVLNVVIQFSNRVTNKQTN